MGGKWDFSLYFRGGIRILKMMNSGRLALQLAWPPCAPARAAWLVCAAFAATLPCLCKGPARPLHSLPLHSPSPSLLCLSLPAPWPSGQDAAAADVLSLSSSILQLQPPSPPHPLCLTAVAPSPRAAGAAGNTATSKVAAAAAGAHGQEAVVRCWPGRDLARVRPDVAKRQHGFPGAPPPLHHRRRAPYDRHRRASVPPLLPNPVRDCLLEFDVSQGPSCNVIDSSE